jgi:hypothetical protein
MSVALQRACKSRHDVTSRHEAASHSAVPSRSFFRGAERAAAAEGSQLHAVTPPLEQRKKGVTAP